MEKKEEIVVHLKNSMLTLSFVMLEGVVDVDDLTSIHYYNLPGEIVTVSALLNKIGLIKAEAEEVLNIRKMELDIYEAELFKRIRRESTTNAGKICTYQTDNKGNNISGTEIFIKATDASISQMILLDPGYQVKKKNVIKATKDLAYIDSLYWAVQSKDRKLNNIMKQVTPEEFENEIIEGVINGILIKKHEYKTIKNVV